MLQYITDTSIGLSDVLEGGCRWVQLRIKEADDGKFLSEALIISDLCKKYGAIFIIDDRVNLVKECRADGVHLGKSDMSLEDARKILGKGLIIGATANTFEDVIRSTQSGADYIGVGPYKFTTTKKNLSPILGDEGYKEILSKYKSLNTKVPLIAIGGIVMEDISKIKNIGFDGLAVSGLIKNKVDKNIITKQIIKIWENS